MLLFLYKIYLYTYRLFDTQTQWFIDWLIINSKYITAIILIIRACCNSIILTDYNTTYNEYSTI